MSMQCDTNFVKIYSHDFLPGNKARAFFGVYKNSNEANAGLPMLYKDFLDFTYVEGAGSVVSQAEAAIDDLRLYTSCVSE